MVDHGLGEFRWNGDDGDAVDDRRAEGWGGGKTTEEEGPADADATADATFDQSCSQDDASFENPGKSG